MTHQCPSSGTDQTKTHIHPGAQFHACYAFFWLPCLSPKFHNQLCRILDPYTCRRVTVSNQHGHLENQFDKSGRGRPVVCMLQYAARIPLAAEAEALWVNMKHVRTGRLQRQKEIKLGIVKGTGANTIIPGFEVVARVARLACQGNSMSTRLRP